MTDEGNIVKTGFNNLDSLFSRGGLPVGTICNLISEPVTPSVGFLLQIYKYQMPKSHYIAPNKPYEKIEHMLKLINVHPSQIEGVTSYDDITNPEDIITAINQNNPQQKEIVIISGLDELFDQGSSKRDFYSELSKMPIKNEFLLVIHTTATHQQQSFQLNNHTASQISDTIISMTQTATGDDIANTMSINRLPAGYSLRDRAETSSRIIEYDDTGERFEITGGQRI